MNIVKPTAIIYCDHLLYASETFIRAQAGALKRYTPAYAGLRRVKGLELPEDDTHVIFKGDRLSALCEILFKLTGIAPGLSRELHSLHPLLIHAHFGADGFRALPLARRLDIPLIVTFHGSDATAVNRRGAKMPFGHRRYLAHKDVLQRGANQIIAVSHFIKSKLLSQGYTDEQVRVHHIGVDTKLFTPADKDFEPFILFVGRLVERKGLEYLIRAMALVQNEMPSLDLIVIGDGPLRSRLETLAHHSLRRYRFLGVQSPESIRDWMGRALAFAAPSVRIDSGEEEGFGIVFIEAQAMGKPVVSFDSGGIKEAVEHGTTGFLAVERDVKELAGYLAQLASDSVLRNRFGNAGRARVLQMFDLHKQTEILESIYQDVTDRYYAASKHHLSRQNGVAYLFR